MRELVFDTSSLLMLYLGEEGAETVAKLLSDVSEGKAKGYVNVVNLAELYYILHRRSEQVAVEKEKNLRAYGVRVYEIDDGELWRQAAKLEALGSISLADAFAAATAQIIDGELVVGLDDEFDQIKDLKLVNIS
ncbi:MAG: PIN domain-containing protein [Thermoplasmata archaeon]|nr:PIN domain-containing protein [Candidatus Sysuiplasma jiujiangense]